MSGLDLSNESPSDIVVTLRSLPRRFGEALEDGGDEDTEALARRPGPDGRSALDHVATTARRLALLGGALEEVLSGRQPVLPDAVTQPDAGPTETATTEVEGELAVLSREATQLADRIERTPADRWDQVGRVPGGTEMSALDLAREVVRAAITGLRATEAAMAHARG